MEKEKKMTDDSQESLKKKSSSQQEGASQPEKPADVTVAPKKKKLKREIPLAHAYVQSTFNNTLITITDPNGNLISWSSAGKKGFKGARKSTPFAAQVAAEDAARLALDHGVRTLSVFVNGPGSGRESALRGLQVSGVKITYIRDITPIPHNGCRPQKKRRV